MRAEKPELRKILLSPTKKTEILARHFTLTVESSDVSNITAFDGGGTIEPVIEKNPGQSRITLVFNQLQAGIGKSQQFTIAFDSGDVAIKKGRIWEILVPGINPSPEVSSYRVNMVIPPRFGKPAYITPTPETDGSWDLVKHPGGIALAFGDYQAFQYTLEYTLKNESQAKKTETIAIPADTVYQQVILNRLSIEPKTVSVDRDGNWLAAYDLEPHESLQVTAEGVIVVHFNQRTQQPQLLSSEERQMYTARKPFWEISEQLSQKAKDLKSPRAIYDFVVESLTYDFDRVNADVVRMGASEIVEKPDIALCLEYADLFVAMAREAGIPARLIEGYAYTANNRLQPLSLVADVLHAWPQYYDEDKKAWISIDPTWADTTNGIDYFNKLDFNHIAFVTLGESSSEPKAAGSYKSETSGKDVFINFIDDVVIPEPKLEIELQLPTSPLGGFNTKGSMRIKNVGAIASPIDYTSVKLALSKVSVTGDVPTIIAPYATLDIPFLLKSPFSLTNKTETVEGNVNGQLVSKKMEFVGILNWLGQNIQALVILGLAFILTPLLLNYARRS